MVPVNRELLAARERAELLVPYADVVKAIDQVSVRLTLACAESNPLLLCVMQGGLAFAGALQQRLHFPLECDYLQVSRYGVGTSGNELQWRVEPQARLANRCVVLVDDVLDEGVTLAELQRWAQAQGASEVLSAVLVDKQIAAPRTTSADFVALQCPDRFLLGWGMDLAGYWRNLDGIYALPEDDPLTQPGALAATNEVNA